MPDTSIDDLPPEVMIKIFEHLAGLYDESFYFRTYRRSHPRRLIWTVVDPARVCWGWNTLVTGCSAFWFLSIVFDWEELLHSKLRKQMLERFATWLKDSRGCQVSIFLSWIFGYNHQEEEARNLKSVINLLTPYFSQWRDFEAELDLTCISLLVECFQHLPNGLASSLIRFRLYNQPSMESPYHGPIPISIPFRSSQIEHLECNNLALILGGDFIVENIIRATVTISLLSWNDLAAMLKNSPTLSSLTMQISSSPESWFETIQSVEMPALKKAQISLPSNRVGYFLACVDLPSITSLEISVTDASTITYWPAREVTLLPRLTTLKLSSSRSSNQVWSLDAVSFLLSKISAPFLKIMNLTIPKYFRNYTAPSSSLWLSKPESCDLAHNSLGQLVIRRT